MKIYVEGTGTEYDELIVDLRDQKGPRFNFVSHIGPPRTIYLYPTGRVHWVEDTPIEIWAPKDADIQS